VGERKHGWASQRAVARRGGQRGPDAGCGVVTVSAFLSGLRSPVRASGVRCPAGPVQVTGVRCGRLSRCPVSVRRRPLCPTGMRSWGVAVGPAAVRLGWPGSRGRPPCPRRRVVCPRLEPGPGGWHRPCWASGGSASTWSSSWAVVGQWARSTRWPTGRGGMRARIARRSAADVTTLRGHGAAKVRVASRP
jgi:hypothetical protein